MTPSPEDRAAGPPDDPLGCAFYFCTLSAARDILPRLLQCLDPREMARLETYRLVADRERFLLGRALLRLLAGAILGVEPRSVSLQFTSRGKPVIAEGGLHVNVSHSGDVVALALSARPVGIDVETIAQVVPFEAATIAFSTNERACLSRIAGDERRRLFYEIWTRKEALLKADGRGLHDDLPSVETMRSDGSWRPSVRLGETEFGLGAIAAPPGTIAAAASTGRVGRIEPLLISAERLRQLAAGSLGRSRDGDGPISPDRPPSRNARCSAPRTASAARSG